MESATEEDFEQTWAEMEDCLQADNCPEFVEYLRLNFKTDFKDHGGKWHLQQLQVIIVIF